MLEQYQRTSKKLYDNERSINVNTATQDRARETSGNVITERLSPTYISYGTVNYEYIQKQRQAWQDESRWQ